MDPKWSETFPPDEEPDDDPDDELDVEPDDELVEDPDDELPPVLVPPPPPPHAASSDTATAAEIQLCMHRSRFVMGRCYDPTGSRASCHRAATYGKQPECGDEQN
jgi:hypothetical protein